MADQVEYSLREQGPSTELLPHCRENDVTLIAYTPLAKGNLAKPGNPVLDKLARKYDRTQAQVALNWLISQRARIPKASNAEHLRDNLGAVGWRMDGEDQQRLARSYV